MAAGEDTETYNEEHAQSIDVTFDIHEIKIRNNKHLFICSYDKLFDTGLIAHHFHSNEKAIELLKGGKLEFNHYEKEKKLFLKYGVQGLDLFITIGIPHKLFDLDVESCDEKEQLQYYKDKAIKLEQILTMNNIPLQKYTVSEFNKESVYTGFTLKELSEDPKDFHQQYGTSMSSIEGFQTIDHNQIEEHKRQDVFCVGRDWQYVTTQNNQYIYFNPRRANKPLVEVTQHGHEILLNVRKLYLNQRVRQLHRSKQYQQFLDEMSQDIMVGVIGDYDLLQTLESDPFNIPLSFYEEQKHYQVNMFYRFVVRSSGKLVIKYLHCVECVSSRPDETKPRKEKVTKIQKPRISWIEKGPHPPRTNGVGPVDTRTYYCFIPPSSWASSWPGIRTIADHSNFSLSGSWTLFAMTH